MAETRHRVLFVDDEPNLLAGIRRHLGRDFDLSTATSGREALDLIATEPPFEVVVADMQMPGMDGVSLLRRVKAASPESLRVMLTGHSDLETAIAAVNEGHIFRFLTKPCPTSTLRTTLDTALEQYRLQRAERELLDQTLRRSIKVVAEILSLVNPAAFGRAMRIKPLVCAIAARRPRIDRWELEVATMLSQLGCVVVPAELLERASRGEPLTAEEGRTVADHPRLAYELLSQIPRMENVARIVLHQVRKPGAGGREAADGERAVPWESQVLRVVLEYDDLICGGKTPNEALTVLRFHADRYDRHALALLVAEVDERRNYTHALLKLDQLARGMILESAVSSDSGVLLAAAGLELSDPLLTVLRNRHRVDGVKQPIAVKVPSGAQLPEPSVSEGDSMGSSSFETLSTASSSGGSE